MVPAATFTLTCGRLYHPVVTVVQLIPSAAVTGAKVRAVVAMAAGLHMYPTSPHVVVQLIYAPACR